MALSERGAIELFARSLVSGTDLGLARDRAFDASKSETSI
jgi:hypothetical protein